MNLHSANIQIKRDNGVLGSISVIMPVWDKFTEDDFIAIDIPLFGINTFAQNESDIEISIKESITAFCKMAEKFGKGLESELKILGWNFEDSKTKNCITMSFDVPRRNTVMSNLMKTGEQFADELEMTC